MPDGDPKVKAERIVATGFLAIGPKTLNEQQRAAVRTRRRGRADRRDDAGVPRHHRRVRPVPRPQVRPDPAEGLLRPRGHLPQHRNVLRHGAVHPEQPAVADAHAAEGLRPARGHDRHADRRREGAHREADRGPEQADCGSDRPDPHDLPARAGVAAAGRLDAFDADGNPKLLAMGVRDKPRAGGRRVRSRRVRPEGRVRRSRRHHHHRRQPGVRSRRTGQARRPIAFPAARFK